MIRSLPLFFAAFFMFLSSGCSRLPLSMGERVERITGLRPEGVRPETKLFRARWTKNHDPEYRSGNLPIGLAAPVIHQGIVYIGRDEVGMSAYALESGRLLWQSEEFSTFHTAPTPFQDQILYGTVQGRLISRHALTGELNYEIDLGASIESRPVLADGRMLVHLRNHQIFCLDASTGKVLWAYRRAVPFLTTLQRVSAPLVADGKVFVGFADGFAAAFSLEDGLLLWERRLSSGAKFVDVDTDPLLFENQLYMGSYSGNYSILEPQTGQLIHQIPHTVSRAAMVLGDRLVVGTVNGKVMVLNRQLREIQTLEFAGSITSLNIWRGHLVVATTRGQLHAVDLKDFSLKETFHFGHSHSAVFGQVQVEGERLVVLSSRNRLYTF